MKKKLIYILLLSFMVYTKEAYAVFDVMALIQTNLEKFQNVMKQAQEVKEKAEEIKAKVQQGFDAAKSAMACASKPSASECSKVAQNLTSAYKGVKQIKETRAMGEELSSDDLFRKDINKLEDSVRDTIYQKGLGDDFKRLRANRKANNAVVADDLALLFAKGVVTRQMIIQEDGKMYQQEFANGNLDEILNAQKNVRILSDLRLAQILEMRTFMISAQATSELTMQNHEEDKNK